jgi:hypothetical protein
MKMPICLFPAASSRSRCVCVCMCGCMGVSVCGTHLSRLVFVGGQAMCLGDISEVCVCVSVCVSYVHTCTRYVCACMCVL